MPRRIGKLPADPMMRKILAHKEEQLLLFREMVKIQQETYQDLVDEIYGTADPFDQMEREMEVIMERKAPREGTEGPRHDV